MKINSLRIGVAAERESHEFLKVVEVVRNRAQGGSLSSEDPQIVQWIERFRVGSASPKRDSEGRLRIASGDAASSN
jgi:hypothetical protein